MLCCTPHRFAREGSRSSASSEKGVRGLALRRHWSGTDRAQVNPSFVSQLNRYGCHDTQPI
eukprot:4322840-Amphidinium_carterae.1